jgi:acyl carrier protein
VAGVWREVLGADRVGADDDFFALGGDSLAAARVIARIRAAFGVEMPITALFEEPTLAAQAAWLVSARIESSDPSLVQSLLDEERVREAMA